MKKHQKNLGHFFNAVTEKIGVKEWLHIKAHSRMLYLKLRSEDINLYDLQQEDVLLVQLIAVKKAPRDLDAGEGKQ
jgi:hypothetical protein